MRNFEKIEKSKFEIAIKNSASFRQLAKNLDVNQDKAFNDYVRELGFDISHFTHSYPGSSKYQGSIGKTFGYLTINSIESINKNIYSHYYANCTCKCGNKIQTLMASIRNGLTRSCGCLYKEVAQEKSKESRKNLGGHRYSYIKRSAKKRGYEFSLSIEYLRDLFNQCDGKCYFTGIQLLFGPSDIPTETTASLDRIDNNKPYIEGNVQWVHKDVNKMRGEMTIENFIKACKLISERFSDD